MAFDWRVNETDRIVEVESKGKTGLGDVLECIIEVSSDPRCEALDGILVDNREMQFNATVGDALEIGDGVRRFLRDFNGRVAVVSAPGFIHQLARMVCALPLGVDQRAFTDIDAARDWVMGRD